MSSSAIETQRLAYFQLRKSLMPNRLYHEACVFLAAVVFILLPAEAFRFAEFGQRELAADEISFNNQIRPLLSRHCLACHGTDEGDRQADLRLDTFEGATDYAIVPGDPDDSEVVDRIETDDPDLRMPPLEHSDGLTPDEIALLKRWIDEGAEYETHWSFASPEVQPIPSIAALTKLAGNQAPRVHNEIDNFILASVYKAGLQQNPVAEPASLVRRASLTLTGLPPATHSSEIQTAIDLYLSEPNQKSFSAYVDCLLESPACAEHWAAVWLDIARYADTCGYSGDEQRDIWPWRDWLIRALQQNMSYKDLSIEMLAGDLLPNATNDQRLATAFHRNTLSNNEGGTNDEEFRVLAVKDRLSTTLNAWMGLTVRCAECHSHKYDPISQKEYYQLLDFFNQTVDSDNRDDRPKLEVHAEIDPQDAVVIDARIAEVRKQLADQPAVWHVFSPTKTESREGTTFELLDDDSILATGPNPGTEEYAFTFELPAGTTVQAIRLEALTHVRNDGNVGRSPEGSFILSQIRLAKLSDDESETVLPFADAANDFSQVNRHARTAIQPEVKSGGHQGWAVKHPVDGYRANHEAIFQLKDPLVAESESKFKLYLLHDPPWKRLNMGCMRISICDVEDAVAKYDQKMLDPLRREIGSLLAQRDAPVRVPVLEQRPAKQFRETYINLRGNYQSKGEKVAAKFPKAFRPVKDEIPLDRLGLAQWLFRSDNPLTARVAVNRYWARVMGIGMVETEEDFGTQGTPPSHPELLDNLAISFREYNWDVRALLKQLVMSATWQQSQQLNEKMLEIDPRNRLLARGPRIRLSAEVVRDQALAVSGLLSNKMFGRPVYPPSPIKKVVNAFTGGMTWQESTGEDRYRRAVYTYLKRSAPHPLFETFDMSSRDVCSLRRQTTNTPLQSFMTLNDITFIEAARALGARMLKSAETVKLKNEDAMIDSMITFGLETALYNKAKPAQVSVLSQLYRSCLESFSTDLQSAAELARTDASNFEPSDMGAAAKGQLAREASMTVVSNVILNLDSFLNN